MFILDLSKSYFWPVTFEIPSSKKNARAGDKDKNTIEFEFKRLKSKEVQAIFAGESKGDMEILSQFVVGWRKVMASAAEELPYSEEALENLIEEAPGVANAIVKSFFESIGSAKEKN